MVNFRLRTIHYLITHILQSPAKVNLLHVGKKTFVKSSSRYPILFFDKHGSACCPKHFSRLLVLTFILLYLIKHPATTERIAIFINKSTGSAGMFKMIFLRKGPDFWCCGSYKGITF